MKLLIPFIALMLAGFLNSCRHETSTTGNAVNPVIGDISFVSRYGTVPDDATSESLRIRTHLQYVEQLLRSKDVSGLPVALQQKRAHLLDLLQQYRLAGVFPKNYDHPGRRVPCFIDRSGNICAVGFLVAHTAGIGTAEAINREYKYAELSAIKHPALEGWISGSGLTREEAAMIQPSYGYAPDNSPMNKGFAISSAAMSGVNISLAAVNGIGMLNRSGNRYVPFIGLATGIGQVLLGVAGYPEATRGWQGQSFNKTQETVAMLNIGLGTTGIIMSTLNLLTRRPLAQRKTAWNLYSFPTYENKAGLAFSMTRRF